MRPTVYIETTVISYLTAKPSRDLLTAAYQQITREWWEESLINFEAFISPVVLEEISKGDADAAQRRLREVSSFGVLEVSPQVKFLADMYFSEIDIPEKARADSFHLALTTHHRIDYLVS